MRPDLDAVKEAFPAGRPGSAAIRRLCDYIEHLESQIPKDSDEAWQLFQRLAREEIKAKKRQHPDMYGPVPADEKPPEESGTPQGGG